MAVLALLIIGKAVAIWAVLGGLTLALWHWVRTKQEPHVADSDDGHNAHERPILQMGPRIGWYIRAVEWPESDG